MSVAECLTRYAEGRLREMPKLLEDVFDEIELWLARRASRRMATRPRARDGGKIITNGDGPFQAKSSRFEQNQNKSLANQNALKPADLMLKVLAFAVLIFWSSSSYGQQLRDTFRNVQQAVVIVRTEQKGLAPFPQQGFVS